MEEEDSTKFSPQAESKEKKKGGINLIIKTNLKNVLTGSDATILAILSETSSSCFDPAQTIFIASTSNCAVSLSCAKLSTRSISFSSFNFLRTGIIVFLSSVSLSNHKKRMQFLISISELREEQIRQRKRQLNIK